MNFRAQARRPGPEQAADARARLAAGVEAEALACGARTGRPVLAPAVLDAIRAVPRHAFVPGLPFEVAHDDEALPIGHGQTISQPFVVALMTELADLGPADSVLEVGTGSGYQAAIL
ncbi:MAG: protein-L-isoaspartate O-methyltransferase family protein, partial [Alphaproteobacteria bacterium]